MDNQPHNTKTVALSGASGFVGSAFVWHALVNGYKIRALTRAPQEDIDGITWLNGALGDPASLEELCTGADVVIHIAGAIKAKNRDVYLTVNEGGTRAMIDAATKAGVMDKGHFIHLSSLAAREPNMSSYAHSKYKSELAFENLKGNWSILRPPAVYGPFDKETLKLFKMMKLGFAPMAGSRRNRFSLIHVHDLASALLSMIGQSQTFGQTYEISDGKIDGYMMADVAKIAQKVLGSPVRAFTMPASLVKGVGAMNDLIAPLFGVVPMLGREKARELLHPDWVSKTNLLNDSGLWSPDIKTEKGLAETITYYKQKGLL